VWGGWARLVETYSSRAEKGLHLWLCIMERGWCRSRAQYTRGHRACPARCLAAGGLRVGLIPKLAEAVLPPKLDIPAMIPCELRVCGGVWSLRAGHEGRQRILCVTVIRAASS
jgi:hypothetical protein